MAEIYRGLDASGCNRETVSVNEPTSINVHFENSFGGFPAGGGNRRHRCDYPSPRSTILYSPFETELADWINKEGARVLQRHFILHSGLLGYHGIFMPPLETSTLPKTRCKSLSRGWRLPWYGLRPGIMRERLTIADEQQRRNWEEVKEWQREAVRNSVRIVRRKSGGG